MKSKPQFIWIAWVARLTMLAGCAGVWPCLGQGTIYRDRSVFEAAISSMVGIRTDVDFQPPLPPGGIDEGLWVRYFSPLTMSGLTFRSGGPLLIRLDSIIPGPDRKLNNYDSLTPLTVDMNGPAMAFGADFSSWLSPVYSNFLATVTLDNGTVFTFTAAAADPDSTFFGFVTTQPFSSLTFSDGGLIGIGLHEEILDNITVVTIPEPGMVGLFGLGALVLGWHLHGSSRNKEAAGRQGNVPGS